MTYEELKSKTRTILTQVRQPLAVYALQTEGLTVEVPSRGCRPPDFVAESGQAWVINDPLLLLRTLYAQCDPDLKSSFASLLLGELSPENAEVVAHAVVDSGGFDTLQHRLFNLDHLSPEVQLGLWSALDQKLAMESHVFTDSDLSKLTTLQRFVLDQLTPAVALKVGGMTVLGLTPRAELARKLRPSVERVGNRISRVLYLRLRKELLEVANPEINADKEILISRMETLGFRADIMTALHEVERKLRAAATALDFKGCMDLLRTIYEEIVEDAGRAMSQATSAQLPNAKRDFQPWNGMLVTTGVLTRDESGLSQKLYNYLSNAGTHRLGSAPEQVRVSKNMVIELGLLIVGRVQAGVQKGSG